MRLGFVVRGLGHRVPHRLPRTSAFGRWLVDWEGKGCQAPLMEHVLGTIGR